MHVILEGLGVSLTTGCRRQSHVKGFEDLEGKLFKWISAFKLEYLCLASLTDRRAQEQCPEATVVTFCRYCNYSTLKIHSLLSFVTQLQLLLSFGYLEKVSSENLYSCLNRSEIKENLLKRLSIKVMAWVYP